MTKTELEKSLIDLYETAMLHGEAQANGVLPTQEHREQTILLALDKLLALIERAELRAREEELVELIAVLNDVRGRSETPRMAIPALKSVKTDIESRLAQLNSNKETE